MDLFSTIGIYVAILIALIFSGMPIAFALGLMAVGSIYFGFGTSLLPALGHVTWGVMGNFVIGAIPLFVFMGVLLFETGISTRVYASISPLLDRLLPGGILHSNIVVGAVFAACSGSSSASCATIGSIAIPEMERRGYDRGLAVGSVGAAGSLGILIPPSVVMIIYGAMTEVSVGKLFVGGIIPGLILALFYMAYIGIRLAIQPQLIQTTPMGQKLPWSTCVWRLFRIWPVLILIAGVLGSIYGGIATPTEAAAFGCVIVFILAAFYHMINWPTLKKTITNAVRISSMILMIYLGASLMAIYLSNAGITRAMARWVAELNAPPLGIFLAIVVMYLILGMLMDSLAAMVMTLPITFPIVVTTLRFDPIWYGVMMVMLCECGLLSPPVGLNLFVLQGLRPNYPFKVIAGGCLPFFFVVLAVIFIMILMPDLVTFLPRTMLG